MFDQTLPIDIFVPTSEEDKKVTVSFPSDKQWMDRARKQKILVRSIGREKTTTEVTKAGDSDLALFDLIKKDDVQLDSYEASYVINKLWEAEVVSSEREGNRFRVTLKTLGGEAVHVMKRPSLRQSAEYGESLSKAIDNGRTNTREITVNIEAAGQLYDTLKVEVEGYTTVPPIIHKAKVVRQVLDLSIPDEDDSNPSF